jgi:hypothetical protein
MKNKILLFVTIFAMQFSISQTEKTIHGKVICDFFPVQGIKVINLITEKSTVTNNNGVFQIAVKPNEMLVFSGLGYNYKRKTITIEDSNKDNLVIEIEKKPTELKEVVVAKTKNLEIPFDVHSSALAGIMKNENQPKVVGVYDGSINYGLNFAALFTEALKLFKKDKSKSKTHKKIQFDQFANSKLKQSFFTNQLQLKPDEMALFFEYCDADPKSQSILESNNQLIIMDFITTKNIEFKNLKPFENEKKD